MDFDLDFEFEFKMQDPSIQGEKSLKDNGQWSTSFSLPLAFVTYHAAACAFTLCLCCIPPPPLLIVTCTQRGRSTLFACRVRVSEQCPGNNKSVSPGFEEPTGLTRNVRSPMKKCILSARHGTSLYGSTSPVLPGETLHQRRSEESKYVWRILWVLKPCSLYSVGDQLSSRTHNRFLKWQFR